MKRRHDLELVAASTAHYEDPEYYTDTYKSRIDDVAYYVTTCLTQGGPVLEYGAGNGRISLPLARHGIEVTCVDRSKEMLADLARRVALEPKEVRDRIKLVRGDMRDKRLAKKFPLVICPFNTALHLYERDDVERFLASVRHHMTKDGRFICDLSIPMPEDLIRTAAKAESTPDFEYPGIGRVGYTETFDYDRVRQILFVMMDFVPRDKAQTPFATPLAHRQFFPREWEALLHYNGFEVKDVRGDFEGGALTQNSDTMIWHAMKKRAKKR